ncbi:MAG: hypothetical protein GY762_12900 [Proteobacteria bacterium]|nr:hypothetical protein [Pseudomonadota bacterium]
MVKTISTIVILVAVTVGTQSFAQEGDAEANGEASPENESAPVAAVSEENESAAAETVPETSAGENVTLADSAEATAAVASGEADPPVDPNSGQAPAANKGLVDAEPEEIVLPPLTWLLTFSVMAAQVKNTVTFTFPTPEEGGGDEESKEQKMTLSDKGWGVAFSIVGFYKWLTITNVCWYMPNVNNARTFGGIFYLDGKIPTGTFIQPTIGFGLFYTTTATQFSPFYSSRSVGNTDSGVTFGYADFDDIEVKVNIIAPIPTVGLFIKLPLYNWWIKPQYSFKTTFTWGNAKNPAGRVDIWRDSTGVTDQPGVDDPGIVIGGPVNPDVLQFDEPFDSKTYNHMLGFWFNIDYNYFVSLMGQYNANVVENLHSIRLIGTVFINRYVGLSAVFDYQQFRTVTNIGAYFGPSFLFMTAGFMDAVEAKRDQAMAKRNAAKQAAREAEAGAEEEWVGDEEGW